MVTAAAREIADGEVVFVGMRLPLLAFMLAKSTHAPHALGLFESGVLRDSPAAGPIITMGDSPNQCGAIKLTDLAEVMTLLSGGRVALGFIGGAQVDQWGHVNTHQVARPGRSPLRLPGSGGGADIACLAGRLLIIMNHERRRLVPRVDYITSPGWGEEPGWRQAQGLERGGPAALITSLGVFRFPAGRALLTEIHPGVSLEEVAQATGWPLEAAPQLATTPEPTQQEVEIIRQFDPQGFWTR
ncbi:MAG: CoA-transferase [Deltaproteobacteria bacterium]|nr:CoA-transferase [Deltaproteobacteria bacterium]